MSLPKYICVDNFIYKLEREANGGVTSKCGIYLDADCHRKFIKFFKKKGNYISEIENEVQMLQKVKELPHSSEFFAQIIAHGPVQNDEINFMYLIVFEMCKGVELLGLKLTEEDRKIVSSKLIEAVGILHENGIVHCDIKLENILYHKRLHKIKLVDFGAACQIGTQKKGTCTTAYICPPEFLSRVRSEPFCFDKSFDIWSVGICYTKIMGVLPESVPHFFLEPAKRFISQ
jgi:serine/threonine protein kinase